MLIYLDIYVPCFAQKKKKEKKKIYVFYVKILMWITF